MSSMWAFCSRLWSCFATEDTDEVKEVEVDVVVVTLVVGVVVVVSLSL